ncbi:alkaline phosphatase D family protein [Marinomonas sp. 2405UD68-3]|uniref:alkaline phosphatase D family protein n=1 Tax=Marinomonas sp. 2405UD68-3 TaxID=3391835 RepID=UPI0039C9F870
MPAVKKNNVIDLPPVIAGPILRKTNPNEITLWLATCSKFEIACSLKYNDVTLSDKSSALAVSHQCIPAGKYLYLHFIHITIDNPIPYDVWVEYHLQLNDVQANKTYDMSDWASHLYYQGHHSLGFILHKSVTTLLHGSCRKPHFNRQQNLDGLANVDKVLSKHTVSEWPSLLILSGDQVYTDDVAGPMLHAIHQVIGVLGLPNETLEGAEINDSETLHTSNAYYYQRNNLLPSNKETQKLHQQFFGGVQKPVFTTDTAYNHLITLSEMIAMYLLVWSPVCWQFVQLSCSEQITLEKDKEKYEEEKQAIINFKQNLPSVQRALAHLPTAMMFDDHDVTDDWNLNAAWEKSAYEHPFSRRIIGNALIAYLMFQGWGNNPADFSSKQINSLKTLFIDNKAENTDRFINDLLKFDQWHYEWPTNPPLVVLDTRTRRWRSESNLNNPSGLMDWEALTELQQTLLNKDAVILVSPAPIFGVKLIETVQRIFTWFGFPLIVDAENWMSHPGSAHALLNLFRHPKTPHNFVILSGDVHYSFVYDIKLKGRKNSPNIWQITSSGLRNEFPDTLLNWFDRLNRWLYTSWSPLNWFTKRRGMWVSPRKPSNASKGERLINRSGIGLVILNKEGQPTSISQLSDMNTPIHFQKDTTDEQFE